MLSFPALPSHTPYIYDELTAEDSPLNRTYRVLTLYRFDFNWSGVPNRIIFAENEMVAIEVNESRAPTEGTSAMRDRRVQAAREMATAADQVLNSLIGAKLERKSKPKQTFDEWLELTTKLLEENANRRK